MRASLACLAAQLLVLASLTAAAKPEGVRELDTGVFNCGILGYLYHVAWPRLPACQMAAPSTSPACVAAKLVLYKAVNISACAIAQGGGGGFGGTRGPSHFPTTHQPTTLRPTAQPSARPSHQPTAPPTLRPSRRPSPKPTLLPSSSPTKRPTHRPTPRPTPKATYSPTGFPTLRPVTSRAPSLSPNAEPTRQPSRSPSVVPTQSPTLSSIYVNPSTGSDSYPGSRALPKATIQAAISASLEQSPSTPIPVVLMSGTTHRLLSPVNLASKVDVIGEDYTVTVTGSMPLEGLSWSSVANMPGVYQTSLPKSLPPLGQLSTLFVDGQPAIRARYPNQANYFTASYAPAADVVAWTRRPPSPPSWTTYYPIATETDNTYKFFFFGFEGACQGIFDPPVGYFCAQQPVGTMPVYTIPGGAVFSTAIVKALHMSQWSATTAAFLHAMHPLKWGGWVFEMASSKSTPPVPPTPTILAPTVTPLAVPTNKPTVLKSGRLLKNAPYGATAPPTLPPGQFKFVAGGFQEARGDLGMGAGDYFIDNVLQLLDQDNEYYLSVDKNMLYYKPAGKNPNNLKFELSFTRTLFQAIGTLDNPVTDVLVANITFAHTYPTYMDPHEVPSGGDWSIIRNGAVLLEGVERITVRACSFNYLGGNGIVVSNYAANTTLDLNTFSGLGASAVVVVGNPKYFAPDPWDMRTEFNFPVNTVVSNSWASNFGLMVQQSAAVFIALAHRTRVHNCVFHDGPRSGININDGFLGGHVLSNNILFNLVTITMDHGPINSWNRQRWLQAKMEPNLVQYNFLVGTSGGPLGIDLDDGSENFVGNNNLIVYGCIKFKGMRNAFSTSMVLLPLPFGNNYVTHGCIVINQGDSAAPMFSASQTTCVSQAESVSFGAQWTMPCQQNTLWLYNNTYYATAFYPCSHAVAPKALPAFVAWQHTGEDALSTFYNFVPDANTLLIMAQSFNLNIAPSSSPAQTTGDYYGDGSE